MSIFSRTGAAAAAFVFSFGVQKAYSQNLVPNGSFEQYHSCPTAHSQLDSCMHWFNPSTNQAGAGSPDYYHACGPAQTIGVPANWFGYEHAYDGDAYAGAYLFIGAPQNAREYLEVELIAPLQAGIEYLFAMQVSLGDICRHTTDDIGVYFSNAAVTGVPTYAPLPFTPQVVNVPGNTIDTLGWTLVLGNYVALGGETHIIIGNFNDDANTTVSTFNANAAGDYIYVAIDDVHLVPLVISSIDKIKVKPFMIYPNPSKGEVYFTLRQPLTESAVVGVTDPAGRLVRRLQLEPGTSGPVPLGLGAQAAGVFLVTMTSGSDTVVERIVRQ